LIDRIVRMSSFITDIVDYFSTFFTDDIGTAKCPLLFLLCHAVFLGCALRPVVDKRPNGEKRHWLTSVVLHVLLICGGSSVTGMLLGYKPGLLAGNLGWFVYALGWFLAGFDQFFDLVKNSPAKFVVAILHALSRSVFVASAIVEASEVCPGGLLVIIVPIMDSHATDWMSYPIFAAVEGKPLSPCNDWISFSSGVRNTFWAALLYYIFSGRAFGAFLPDPLRFWVANASVAFPLVYDAFFNACLGCSSSALGFIEAPIGALVSYIQNVRDKMNEEYRKKRDNNKEEHQDEKSLEEKKDQ